MKGSNGSIYPFFERAADPNWRQQVALVVVADGEGRVVGSHVDEPVWQEDDVARVRVAVIPQVDGKLSPASQRVSVCVQEGGGREREKERRGKRWLEERIDGWTEGGWVRFEVLVIVEIAWLGFRSRKNG
jgi:hypothetical protein